MRKYEIEKRVFLDMVWDILEIERIDIEEISLFLNWLDNSNVCVVEIRLDKEMKIKEYLRKIIREYGEWGRDSWLDGCYVNKISLSDIWKNFYEI